VPGLIQAEDFDNGGEGVAYHDLTTANEGGSYRTTTGVDIEATTDTGGGYNVGWALAGEWLKYTVNVAAAGTYTLDLRVASNGAGGTFHVESNGVNKTGTLSVPNTGAWQTWTTISVPVQLSAGQQVLRLAFDTLGINGYTGNFNWLKLTAVSSGVPAAPSNLAATAASQRSKPGGRPCSREIRCNPNHRHHFAPGDDRDVGNLETQQQLKTSFVFTMAYLLKPQA
jgi:hypothetical protein